MLNVIKMDLYRLSRSKAFKIGLILTVIICLGAVLLSAGLFSILQMTIESADGLDESYDLMSEFFTFLKWINGVDLAVIILSFSGIMSLLIVTILSSIFVSDEYTAGFGKNYLGQLPDKGMSVISKLIATSVINLSILLTGTLVAAGAGAIFFGKYISGFDFGNLALTLVLRLLMYLAINAIIVFVCLLTQSKSASLIIGVIFGVGASNIVYGSVTSLFQFVCSRFLKLDGFTFPSLDEIIPDGVLRMLDMSFFEDPDQGLIVRVLIVALVYIVGFAAGSVLLVRRRDVK